MAKISPYQNFPGIQSMIFSKRTIRTTSIPKIEKIHSGVWKLRAKKPSKLSILAKNGQILAISEFSRHIYYDFLKEDHKGSFHTKNYENFQRRLEDIGQKHSKMAILAKNDQILTIFGHFGVQKIFRPKKLETHTETQLHAKNQKKNIEQSRLQDRNARMDGQTHKSEFIGSFLSLKTSREPKNNVRI